MFNEHTVDPFSFLQGWASVLFKRTFRSRIHFRSVQRNISFSTYISDLFVLYVHFGSVQKNVLFSTFISVQWKWMFRSLRSFLLCKKNVLFILVWSQKSPKMTQKRCHFPGTYNRLTLDLLKKIRPPLLLSSLNGRPTLISRQHTIWTWKAVCYFWTVYFLIKNHKSFTF